ncbi:MAG: Asp-tRNA(Asn)/Glu-tRNA(Gln) amidotransferase subunit GatB [Clostridiales bacterium]|jgi:aspartyl-tRNA(Asn)/glutamyl-tRNA(Gln) amidotransferase subunit B|nr:Asp-tRNA(Asn)/Glu-tRNA(Gln) amidotransferase subunit GatB [Clostridiales bacterium]
MMRKYVTSVGLEVHAVLLTVSKIFCKCRSKTGSEPNEDICPICMGYPGTLPNINKKVFDLAIRVGLICNCQINRCIHFDRKNYFYPDTSKSYQITQSEMPVAKNGYFKLPSNGKIIKIERIHLEEDSAKMFHDEHDVTLIDFNRSGRPLIELVTSPDLNSFKEASEFASEISSVLEFGGISEAKMNEGTIRFDVNVSMSESDDVFGQRVEIKNLNSLESLEISIRKEEERQRKIIESGGKVKRETRRYNESEQVTELLRDKEENCDYRYFCEPDIPSICFTGMEIEAIKNQIPLLASERFIIYTEKYKLPTISAKTILSNKCISDFFDEVIKFYGNYKSIANFLLNEFLRRFKECSYKIPFSAFFFAKLVEMIDKGVVSCLNAKEILRIMFESGGDPLEIAKKFGFILVEDSKIIKEIVENILEENDKMVKDYKSGKTNVLGCIMKEAMSKLRNAQPQDIKKQIENKLNKK